MRSNQLHRKLERQKAALTRREANIGYWTKEEEKWRRYQKDAESREGKDDKAEYETFIAHAVSRRQLAQREVEILKKKVGNGVA